MTQQNSFSSAPDSSEPAAATHDSPELSNWPTWIWKSVTALILIAVVLAIYSRSIHAPFIFDDSDSVLNNMSIVALLPLIGDAQHPGPLNPPPDLPTSGRPLVNLSLALNFYFGQLQPVGYHIFNIAVHALSVLLLGAMIFRTLRLDFFGSRYDRTAGPLAFAVALLWAVHPLNTDAVVYITQRTELLVGLFYLATLYASLRYWQANSALGRRTWLVLATLACVAGMACKEVMVTAPLMVLLFDRTFLTRSVRQSLRQSWPLYVGLCLSWILLWYLNISGPRSQSAGFNQGIPAYQWWFTQAEVLLFYLKLAFWPWPLSIHYQIPLLSFLKAWPYVLFAAALSLAICMLLWRRSPLGFLGAWLLLILSPTLIVPIATEIAAERRMYLPLAALITLCVVGGYALFQRPTPLQATHTKPTPIFPPLTAILVPIVAIAILFCLLTSRRLEAYDSELNLWQETVARQPHDYLAHAELGMALSSAGLFPEAIDQFRQALTLQPDYAKAHDGLGVAFSQSNQQAEAIKEFQLAINLKPNYPEARNNLGIEYATAGQYAEALQQFQEALGTRPDSPQIYANEAMAYAQLNQSPAALTAAEIALEHGRRLGQTMLVQRLEAWLANYRAKLQKTAKPPENSQ